jgi:hypothetical protein
MTSASFPPAELKDFDRQSASRLLYLLKILRKGPIVLFLGAGVSASAGLPTWNDLMIYICQIFFYHWQWEINEKQATLSDPPRKLSIGFTESEGKDVLALGEAFAKGNSVHVAQQIKNCIRDLDWIWLLRKCLYGEFNSRAIRQSHLVDCLTALCAEHDFVRLVVNYNYDSVFEDALSAKAMHFTVVSDAQRSAKRGSLPIYHVHGYLKRGGGPKSRVILAEDDYHQELVAPYSWSNLIQSALLMESTCLFVGTSMTDPNLRRLLRSAFAVRKKFHYALLPEDRRTPTATMLNALFDRDLSAIGVASIRYPSGPPNDPHSTLPRTLEWLLHSRKRPV